MSSEPNLPPRAGLALDRSPVPPGAGDLAPVVAAVRALPALPDDDGSRYGIRRLTAAWLHEDRSRHTRTAHFRDLAAFLGWCERQGLDPLTARPTWDSSGSGDRYTATAGAPRRPAQSPAPASISS